MRLAKKIPSRRTILGLDELEPRLAPAGLNNFSFTNVDGSLVRVHLSRPLLTNANESSIFTLDNQGLGEQLEEINLTSLGVAADGLSLTVTARAGPHGGDGFVNVGFIDATGINLGAITIHGDLGGIDAGSQSTPATALTALTVQSMGEFGTSTQAGSGRLESDISGKLGALTVASDLDGVFINVMGSIGTVSVGGSLIGATAQNSGTIQATGSLGTVTIGGDILGGTGSFTGAVYAQTSVKKVTVDGNIVGGDGDFSGQIYSPGPLGTLTIGGNLVGGVGVNSGQIYCEAMLASVSVGGSVIGGSGEFSGQIAAASMGPVTLAGSLVGGVSQDTGQIIAGADLGFVTIHGNVVGGAGNFTGQVTSLNGSIAGARVGGSINGSSGENSGQINTVSPAGGSIGPVTIAGNLVGGSGTSSGEIFANTSLASIHVGNSIIAGSNNGAMTRSGAIRAGTSIGAIMIGGSLVGTSDSPVFITAVGQASLAVGARRDVAIASLSVAGKVQYADILAGYDENLNGVNGQASIGPVRVGKDWIASNLIAGVSGNNETMTVTASTNFGGTGSVDLSPAFPNAILLTATIASIVIRGAVLGTPASVNNQDQFGFVAQEIAAFSVGRVAFKLHPGPGNDNLPVGDTGDVNLLEV